jgi:hypothetical protein
VGVNANKFKFGNLVFICENNSTIYV